MLGDKTKTELFDITTYSSNHAFKLSLVSIQTKTDLFQGVNLS